jgi:hypothetical protein
MYGDRYGDIEILPSHVDTRLDNYTRDCPATVWKYKLRRNDDRRTNIFRDENNMRLALIDKAARELLIYLIS